jgi:hypothetical protein
VTIDAVQLINASHESLANAASAAHACILLAAAKSLDARFRIVVGNCCFCCLVNGIVIIISFIIIITFIIVMIITMTTVKAHIRLRLTAAATAVLLRVACGAVIVSAADYCRLVVCCLWFIIHGLRFTIYDLRSHKRVYVCLVVVAVVSACSFDCKHRYGSV